MEFSKKAAAYLHEMRIKMADMNAEESAAYIKYIIRKVDDFPSDLNYKKAVEQIVKEWACQ